MKPNDIPESIITLIAQIADKPYLRNYQNLKTNFGATCKITMKAAEIFIYEHKDQLENIKRALDELNYSKEVHGGTDTEPSTGNTEQNIK